MGITLRNTESLAAAINKASQAGKGLSWVVVGAAVVSAAVEVIKLICVK